MIEPILDRSPCDDCPATTNVIHLGKCAKMGACWISDQDLLNRIIRDSGFGIFDLHEPPVFCVKTKSVGKMQHLEGFHCKQKLNEKGKLIRKMYWIAIEASRRERLREIGALRDG